MDKGGFIFINWHKSWSSSGSYLFDLIVFSFSWRKSLRWPLIVAFVLGLGWDSVQEGPNNGRASNKDWCLGMELTHISFRKPGPEHTSTRSSGLKRLHQQACWPQVWGEYLRLFLMTYNQLNSSWSNKSNTNPSKNFNSSGMWAEMVQWWQGTCIWRQW